MNALISYMLDRRFRYDRKSVFMLPQSHFQFYFVSELIDHFIFDITRLSTSADSTTLLKYYAMIGIKIFNF